MKIQVLIDNADSWMVPFGRSLCEKLLKLGHQASLIHTHEEIQAGDVLAALSCEQILKKKLRSLNRHNLVAHASALPHGKGWSPLTWQILEGKNRIPLTLIEAEDPVDSGVIYDRAEILFEGHELISELRERLADSINDLLLKFVSNYPNNPSQRQQGEETFYARRRPEDSELDPGIPIAQQFEKFRVADNDRYPVFFRFRSKKYTLKIEKED